MPLTSDGVSEARHAGRRPAHIRRADREGGAWGADSAHQAQGGRGRGYGAITVTRPTCTGTGLATAGG